MIFAASLIVIGYLLLIMIIAAPLLLDHEACQPEDDHEAEPG